MNIIQFVAAVFIGISLHSAHRLYPQVADGRFSASDTIALVLMWGGGLIIAAWFFWAATPRKGRKQ